MLRYILVLNCGSSSVKFNLFSCSPVHELQPALQGIIEEIGNVEKSRLKYENHDEKKIVPQPVKNHREALLCVFNLVRQMGINHDEIGAVGHRVVHGGELYKNSVRVDKHVLATIRKLIPIAPLHNPSNLVGLEESIRLLPNVPQVAVFDTAFHGTMPEYVYRYAIPTKWYRQYGVRKYGFHGTSHMYVARRAARILGIPFSRFNGITAHLGNGCSITKINEGRSVDTSMGFTPLEGVVMGTRSGDIDPALISHVVECLCQEQAVEKDQAYERVMNALNKECGLKALGNTNMMQDIRARAVKGDQSAEIAVQIYAYRAAKYIGQYWATSPHVDAIVFTAGVGENEGYIRSKILGFLENLQIQVDEEKNSMRKAEVVIGTSFIKPDHPLSVMVIPTNEEIVIGYDTLYLGYLKQPIPEAYPFEK